MRHRLAVAATWTGYIGLFGQGVMLALSPWLWPDDAGGSHWTGNGAGLILTGALVLVGLAMKEAFRRKGAAGLLPLLAAMFGFVGSAYIVYGIHPVMFWAWLGIGGCTLAIGAVLMLAWFLDPIVQK